MIVESTDSAQKFSILYGIWACHYVGGEVSLQRDAALDFVSEAERHGDAAALCLAHRTLGTTYLTMGEFVVGRQHLERALNFCNPDEHARHRYQYGQDIGASVLCYLCWALWHLGYVEQAAEVAEQAVRHADDIAHGKSCRPAYADARCRQTRYCTYSNCVGFRLGVDHIGRCWIGATRLDLRGSCHTSTRVITRSRCSRSILHQRTRHEVLLEEIPTKVTRVADIEEMSGCLEWVLVVSKRRSA